jgi:hypothetical protein
MDDYDFRPYLNGSAETVTLRLEQPSKVFLMVHAYEYADQETSAYVLTGAAAE